MVENIFSRQGQKATHGILVKNEGFQLNLIDITVFSDDIEILPTSKIMVDIKMSDEDGALYILHELADCAVLEIELSDRMLYVTRPKMKNIKINRKHIRFNASYCNMFFIKADNDDPSLWITE